MSGSVLFISLIPIFVAYGFISSRNHIVRINFGYFFGILLAVLFAVTMRSSFSSETVQNWIAEFSSIDNWLTQNVLISFDILWSVAIFTLFIIIAIASRIILHYLLLGKNPAYVDRKSVVVHGINIGLYFVFSFAVLTFIFANLTPAIGLKDGFMRPLFCVVREWIKWII